jgi:hypothetical protein
VNTGQDAARDVGWMTRARRPEDWDTDLANARAVEASVASILASDQRIDDLHDNTMSYDALDFRFRYGGGYVELDVKEKRQPYSHGIRALWPDKDERNLFIVDETVYRRIVWQGGGGYLAIHDVPGARWLLFGPWDLTLGERVRYGRWGRRDTNPFLKGKLLVDLVSAGASGSECTVDLIASAIDRARSWRERVEPYPVPGHRLPEAGPRPGPTSVR